MQNIIKSLNIAIHNYDIPTLKTIVDELLKIDLSSDDLAEISYAIGTSKDVDDRLNLRAKINKLYELEKMISK